MKEMNVLATSVALVFLLVSAAKGEPEINITQQSEDTYQLRLTIEEAIGVGEGQ